MVESQSPGAAKGAPECSSTTPTARSSRTREGTPRIPRDNSTATAEDAGLISSDDDDDETRTPLSRMSEPDRGRSNTDVSENFPPETFRGEIVSSSDVVTSRQPENSHNFDERPQNFDTFGREQAQALDDAIQAEPVPLARVTNRQSSDDFANDVIARARGDRSRPVPQRSKVLGIPRTQASASALREETHHQFNTSLKPLIWLERRMRLIRSSLGKEKHFGSPQNPTSRSRRGSAQVGVTENWPAGPCRGI